MKAFQKPILKKIARFGILTVTILLVVLFSGLLFLFFYTRYSDSMFQKQNPYLPIATQGIPQSLSFTRNGTEYIYNPDIVNILLLGIDQTSQRASLSNGHQADTIVLLSIHTKTGKVTMVNIPRDAYAPIMHFDFNNEYAYTEGGPICTAHAFGDGGLTSGQMMQATVSQLMYGIPVNAYASLSIDAIAPAVDKVGGVPVKVSFDFQVVFDKAEGETMLLNGEQAEMYVRDRSLPGMSGENVHRVVRQIDFAQSFLSVFKEKSKKNPLFPLQFYQTIKPYTSTNLSFRESAFLGRTLLDADEIEMQYVKVEELEDGFYHVNEGYLRDMIEEIYFIPAT